MSTTTVTDSVSCELFGGNSDGRLVHVRPTKNVLPQTFHFDGTTYHLHRTTCRLAGESMVGIRKEMPRYCMPQYLLPNDLLK